MFFEALIPKYMHRAHFDGDFQRRCVTVKSVAVMIFAPCHALPRSPPGVLRTAVPNMDRETRDEYLVVLQAKDMGGHLGGLSGTTTITVRLTDVNDNPPHFRRSKRCCYQIATLLSAAFNLCSSRMCVCVRARVSK